ncbi:hypothetical protein [Granulicoccus sp. GXG6511]|uniref:hypothetical protein n=1 Tax=Granulicoccus sp. GXG6511 TaxID=3381351 RepID=UPI003D7D6E79
MSEIPSPSAEFRERLKATLLERCVALRQDSRFSKDVAEAAMALTWRKFLRSHELWSRTEPDRLSTLTEPGYVYKALKNSARLLLKKEAGQQTGPDVSELPLSGERTQPASRREWNPGMGRFWADESPGPVPPESVSTMLQVLADRGHQNPVPPSHLGARAVDMAHVFAGVDQRTGKEVAALYGKDPSGLSRERDALRVGLVRTLYFFQVLAGRNMLKVTAGALAGVLDTVDDMVGRRDGVTKTEYKRLTLAALSLKSDDAGFFSVDPDQFEALAADVDKANPSRWNLLAREHFPTVLVEFHVLEARVALALQGGTAAELGYHCCLPGCPHHTRASRPIIEV